MNHNKSSAILCLILAWAFFFRLPLCRDYLLAGDCVSCHKEVYRKGISSFYPHAPFENKECSKCHLKEKIIVKKGSSFQKRKQRPLAVSHSDYLTEHIVLLKNLNLQATYDINVIFKDMSGDMVRKEFRGIVPRKVLDVKRNDQKPPKIHQVKTGPVVRRIFLENTIKWETDKPATSCVEYGFSDRYDHRSVEDNVLKKNHLINIYKLKRGKDYHFRIISRDIFGNQAVSEDFIFNTADISQGSHMERTVKRADGSLAVKQAKPFILNSDLGFSFETTEPAKITVEYQKVREPVEMEKPQIGSVTQIKERCAGLTSGKELTIDACYQCHPPKVLGVSHPVGVAAKGSTKVPEDLPTLKGGIITCVTCHNSHGGNWKYFSRKKVTKDVCNSCHVGY